MVHFLESDMVWKCPACGKYDGKPIVEEKCGDVKSGMATGGAMGAAIGSVIPFIGTAIGATVGGVLGGISSSGSYNRCCRSCYHKWHSEG